MGDYSAYGCLGANVFRLVCTKIRKSLVCL